MRLYKIGSADVVSAVGQPVRQLIDGRGNLRVTGLGRSGRAIIVVIASDDPNFVITTFPED